MKILITGGAGFIGSQLGHYLMEKKHHVTLLDNLSFGYIENLKSQYNNNLKPNFIKMDVRDLKIGKHLKNIDVLFHLAGISSLPECQSNPKVAYDVNVAGTANILEAARRHNVKRVIFSSSSATYENETLFPISETATSRPSLIYSLSKKHAEEVCYSFQKLYGMSIVILRLFNVYGPHMDFRRPNPPLISYIIKCLMDHKNPILHSDGKQARDMIYIDDVLRLCEIVLNHENAKNQIFNIGSGQAHTIREIYQQIITAFGLINAKPIFRSADLLWDKYPHLFEGNYPFQAKFLQKEVNKYALASIEKANKLLGWIPHVSLGEGIQKTVTFAIKNK